MQIVHVNYDDGLTGGATIAARRIFRACGEAGLSGTFVCRRRSASDVESGSLVYPQSSWSGAWLRLKRRLTYFPLRCAGIDSVSVNWVRTGMARYVNSLGSDIVHLHWVKADTLSIEEIAELNAPVVWSLHDLWPCLGLDSYPSSHPASGMRKVIDQWMQRRKAAALSDRGVSFIAPSEWCANQARAMARFPLQGVGVIPYPIDTEAFRPRDRAEARRLLDIREDRFVVLFGANKGTQWPIKGFDRLVAAVRHLSPGLKAEMEIVVFGEEGSPQPFEGVATRFVGRVNDESSLTWLYSAADVFAFPSRQETFGQTKSEALACGLPVISFAETACGEGIEHETTGWVASEGNVADFAAGLTWGRELMNEPRLRHQASKTARQAVIDRYSMPAVAAQWARWYAQVAGSASLPTPAMTSAPASGSQRLRTVP